jgi:hypothetical protein
LAALRHDAYNCIERGFPLPSSDTVARFYNIDSGETVVVVRADRRGNVVKQTVHYTDRLGRRRYVAESESHPLTGADSVARRIFSAAATAPCRATPS